MSEAASEDKDLNAEEQYKTLALGCLHTAGRQ